MKTSSKSHANCLPYEDLRLHHAAFQGDRKTLSDLLAAGMNPDTRDGYYSTPLHIATLNGQLPIVEQLIAAGAKVDPLSYEGITPLFLAVKYQQPTIATALLEAGAEPNGAYGGVNSPYAWIWRQLEQDFFAMHECEACYNTKHTMQNLSLYGLLADIDPYVETPEGTIPAALLLDGLSQACVGQTAVCQTVHEIKTNTGQPELNQYYLDTKNLLHVFAIKGEYVLPDLSHEQLIRMNAEGHFGYYTTELAQRTVADFIKDCETESLQYRLFDQLQAQLATATALINQPHDETQLAQAANTLTEDGSIILPTGWAGHFINLIVSKEYLVIANSGERFHTKPPGALIYKIHHPDALNAGLIKDILTNYQQMDLEYDLHYHLGLELVHILSGPNQVVGNCGWHSFLPAVEGSLFLSLLDMGLEAPYAKTLAHDYFTDWAVFAKNSVLTHYLEQYDTPSFDVLVDILLQEAQINAPDAMARATQISDYLSQSVHAEAFSDFVLDHPVGWLHLDQILKAADVDLNTGLNGIVDSPTQSAYDAHISEQVNDAIPVDSLLLSLDEIPHIEL